MGLCFVVLERVLEDAELGAHTGGPQDLLWTMSCQEILDPTLNDIVHIPGQPSSWK